MEHNGSVVGIVVEPLFQTIHSKTLSVPARVGFFGDQQSEIGLVTPVLIAHGIEYSIMVYRVVDRCHTGSVDQTTKPERGCYSMFSNDLLKGEIK